MMKTKTIIMIILAAFFCLTNLHAQTEVTPPQGELTPEQQQTREAQLREAQQEKERAAVLGICRLVDLDL